MDGWWPWLAVAGSGALHGLNPATGWILAAAAGLRAGGHGAAWRALVPIATGHLAAIGLAAGAVASGIRLERPVLLAVAGALLLAAVAVQLCGRVPAAARRPAGGAGLALWSFAMAGAHGAGLALVPALVSLCSGPGRGMAAALAPALAAVAVHTLAMLAVTGALASGACCLRRSGRRREDGRPSQSSTNRFCAGRQCRRRS